MGRERSNFSYSVEAFFRGISDSWESFKDRMFRGIKNIITSLFGSRKESKEAYVWKPPVQILPRKKKAYAPPFRMDKSWRDAFKPARRIFPKIIPYWKKRRRFGLI